MVKVTVVRVIGIEVVSSLVVVIDEMVVVVPVAVDWITEVVVVGLTVVEVNVDKVVVANK